MSEEKENQAEPVPQKQLGYDPNAGIVNRLNDTFTCEAGEAILAVKITCTADSEGTKLGIGIKMLCPDLKKVKSLVGGFLTMASTNVARAIREKVRAEVNEEFTRPVLMATEEEFAEAVSHKQPKNDTPEEVPHGV